MYNKGLGKGPVTNPKLPITYNSSCCNILFLFLMKFWYDPFDLQDWTWRVSLENHPVKYWSVRSRVGLMQVRLHDICLCTSMTCKAPTKREECFLMPLCVLHAAIYGSCHVHSIACLNPPPSSSTLFLLVQNPF